jgi:hypothetical protein
VTHVKRCKEVGQLTSISQRRRRWGTIVSLFGLACMTVAGSFPQTPFRPVFVVAAVSYALAIGGMVFPPKAPQPANVEEDAGQSSED